jgi:hypothetical protein
MSNAGEASGGDSQSAGSSVFSSGVLGHDGIRQNGVSLLVRAAHCIHSLKQKCKEKTMDHWPQLDQYRENPNDSVLKNELSNTLLLQMKLTAERTHWAWRILQSLDERNQNFIAQPTYAPNPNLKLVTLDIEGPRRAWEKSLVMELSTMDFDFPQLDVEHETHADFVRLLHERLEMQLNMKRASMARMSDARLQNKQYGKHPDYMFQSLLIVTKALDVLHGACRDEGLHAKGRPGVQSRTLAYQWNDPTNETIDLTATGDDFRLSSPREVVVPWDNTERHFWMDAIVRPVEPSLRAGWIPVGTNEDTRHFVDGKILLNLRKMVAIEVEIELRDQSGGAVAERYRFRVEPYAGKGATLIHPFVAERKTRRTVEGIAQSTASDDFRKADYQVRSLETAALYGKPSEINLMASILTHIHENVDLPHLNEMMPAEVGNTYPPEIEKMRVYYHWEDRHRNGRMVWMFHVGDYILGAYIYSPDTEHVWYERRVAAVPRRQRTDTHGRGHGGGGRQAEHTFHSPHQHFHNSFHGYNPYAFVPQAPPGFWVMPPMPPPPPDYRPIEPPSDQSPAPSVVDEGRNDAGDEAGVQTPPQAAPASSGGAGGGQRPPQAAPASSGGAGGGQRPPQAGGRGGGQPPRRGGWTVVQGRGAARGGGGPRGGGGARGGGGGGPPVRGRGGYRGRGAPASAPRSAYPLPPQPRRLATKGEAPWQTPAEDPLRAVLADLAAIKRSLNDAQVLKDVLCG